MDDEERRTRHRSAVDPDNEDDNNYSADKTKNPKKLRKQKAMGELGEETIDEILMITPTTKKPTTKSQSKSKRDPYGEDPAVTRKRLAAKVKKLKEEGEIDEGIGMTMANAIGNPPALSKRMKLKQALIINKIRSDAKKSKEKRYSGKAATATEEYVNEAGDYWHPDPEKDKRISGVANKLRAREDSPKVKVSKVDSDKLKPGESYMQYAKRKAAEKQSGFSKPTSQKKQSLRDRIKTKLGKAIDRAAGIKSEEYDLSETSLNRVRSKSQKGGMAIMSAQRGDKSKKENKARSSQLEKDIRGAGLPGPTKVSGRYTENPGTSQEKKVGEKSHVVSSGKMGKRKFKKAITKLGKKYNQDSVLIQKKPKGDAQLVGTNKSWPGEGKRVKVGKMNPGKTGEFDTKVKNKTFTYEED